jgi:2-iminobutanoate/2-iminopropanoate deaminase
MAKRERIQGKGITEHPQPFSAAVKIGNMVFTSGISGDDPETHKVPDSADEQCANALKNAKTIIETAGGTADGIAKVTVWLKDIKDRDSLNKAWTAMFPDESNRPCRHTLTNPGLAQNRLIQIDFIGVI